jgi:hypothetical protein
VLSNLHIWFPLSLSLSSVAALIKFPCCTHYAWLMETRLESGVFFFSTTVKTSAQIFSVCAHTPTHLYREEEPTVHLRKWNAHLQAFHFLKMPHMGLFSCVSLYH